MLSRYQPPPTNNGNQGPNQMPPPRRRIAVQLPVSEPRLTYILLAVIVLIFVYMFNLPTRQQDLFLQDWEKINDRIREGEYYRLFTAMFLHLNLLHIFFNGYALYILGRDVESLFGTIRFAAIYFLGGLSGSLASFIFTAAPSIGASGAIFALIGAETVYFYHHRNLHGEVGRRHLNQLLFLVVINLVLGFSSPLIDNAAHVGGLVGGVILAWFIGPAYVVKADPETHTLVVEDENPIEKWALPSLLYTVGLALAIVYAITGT
jgi:rhomboid protease GluP